MEVAMRTYILAIATAALFAIPTAAFSESGHHRYYNRYEGLYDRYESERCRESRAACTHKEKLGEQVMGNCRRFREFATSRALPKFESDGMPETAAFSS
jgi:hypothetical protein